MRRSAIAGAVLAAGTLLGVLGPATGSTTAWASGPQHVKRTFLFDNIIPAGTLCDFNFHNIFAGSDNAIIFPDGRMIEHFEVHAIDTNLDTGFTLTDTDHFTAFTTAGGQIKYVGLIFHLRTAGGKLVVNQAGQLVVSATGEVLKVTPSINPNDRAVLCTALGGHPAF
jgi:hypothetical protein